MGSAAYGAGMQDVHTNAKTMFNAVRGVFSCPIEGEECPSEEEGSGSSSPRRRARDLGSGSVGGLGVWARGLR